MNEETKKFFEKLAGVAGEESISDEAEDFEPKLVKAERLDIGVKEDKKGEEIFFDEGDGQLTLDVYQTDNDIVIEAPIAGISVDDLDVEISPESVVIRGKREKREKVEKKDYLYQELYWGRFSRSIILPQEVNPDHAKADFKNGVLKIVLPKVNKQKSKKMKIKFE